MPLPQPSPRPAASRSSLLQVRLTLIEKRAVEAAAAIAGLSISAWARERLRQAASIEERISGVEQPAIRALYRQADPAEDQAHDNDHPRAKRRMPR